MAEHHHSPIKDKPLRFPGQSLDEERQQLIEDNVGQPLILALFFVLLAGLEWWRMYMNMKPNPIVFTAAAVLFLVYAVYRVRRVLPRLRRLRQGMEGEQVVGQFLERLREQGFHVFHDLVGSGFNVDHVLIGPAGVFTIETKTWSKPAAGPAQISFDGEAVRVGAVEPDQNPVVQAKAQASWLKSILRESTGKAFAVRPVILFPGWYVVNTRGTFDDIWVLEPKALPSFLQNEPPRLSYEDVKLASFHLSRFIRSGEKARK